MNNHGNDPAVSRLIAKRAELAGIVAKLERELDRFRADLTHIDGALRVLRADIDPSMIRPRRAYRKTLYFARNELSRMCLDLLRLAAGEALTAEEITIRIMTVKNLERRDDSLLAAVRGQVSAVLKRLHRREIAAPSGKGRGATWRLASGNQP